MARLLRSFVTRLNFCGLLLIVYSVAWPAGAWAATWEVGVLFLGGRENDLYQKDIDRNILELARLQPGAAFRITLLREFPTRAVIYQPEPQSARLQSWDPLFFQPPVGGLPVPGSMEILDGDFERRALLHSSHEQGMGIVNRFFKLAFRDADARRLLILYGHGEGFAGLRAIPLPKLKSLLHAKLPPRRVDPRPLDILWLDACFMSNLETAYELRTVADFLVASEEAEFSAGSPLERLQELSDTGSSDELTVARSLAQGFIESYSYKEMGSQRRFVYDAAATISVIDLNRAGLLGAMAKELASRLGQLTDPQREHLQRIASTMTMEKSELVDFGRLVLRIRDRRELFPRAQDVARRIARALEISRTGKLATNVRLRLDPPRDGQWVVYGYERWERGFEGDEEILGKIPDRLRPDSFVAGPKGRSWPARKIQNRIHVAPFAPGMDRFHFFFWDPTTREPTSPVHEFSREKDIVSFESTVETNPLIYTAYTQSKGSRSEAYLGINVLNPLSGIPTIDYTDLEFFNATGWGGF